MQATYPLCLRNYCAKYFSFHTKKPLLSLLKDPNAISSIYRNPNFSNSTIYVPCYKFPLHEKIAWFLHISLVLVHHLFREKIRVRKCTRIWREIWTRKLTFCHWTNRADKTIESLNISELLLYLWVNMALCYSCRFAFAVLPA